MDCGTPSSIFKSPFQTESKSLGSSSSGNEENPPRTSSLAAVGKNELTKPICGSISGTLIAPIELRFESWGRNATGLDAVEWAAKMASLGAGELLITSMDRDGTKKGFDLELIKAISDKVDVPIIASGGVGDLQHLVDGVKIGGADAVLAASIFHFGEYTINEAKAFMKSNHIEIRQ